MKAKRLRTHRLVEFLEGRLFLSASSAGNGLTAAQLSHLHTAGKVELHLAHSVARNPLSIVASDLAQLYTQAPTGAGLTADAFGSIETKNGEPAISVESHGNLAVLLRRLDKLGLGLIDVASHSHVVDGYLPISALPLAAKLPGVTSVNAIYKPTVHSVGSATNQADQAEDVATARDLYGLTGAGVKIGVISDSVSQTYGGLSDSITTGDLPKNVTVLQDGSYGDTDEGRAILEEIHDLAPNASLYFYSGDGDQSSMANAVTSLKNAGCKVIVDDLGYSGEPFFQDGVISQAINSFVASGGSYFSAIGNDADSGYLRTNLQYTTDAGSKTWVDFAPSGSAADESLRFTLSGAATIDLQWDNPYNGVTGDATSDLNLFIYNFNGTQEVASSTNSNIASGIPEETLHLKAGTYEMRVEVAAVAPGAKAPDMLKFVASADGGGGLAYVNYPGTMSSAYGHGSGQNTISVGAVPFSNAPPFSIATPIHSETYSSTGPIIYAFDANGKALASPLTLDKPDVSGVDGVNTSFFGELTATDPTYLPQFFGTSAAAPNVASIAVLIDQYKPGATEAQILTALKESATPLNGAAAGAWDSQGGYGLVDAVKTLHYFGVPTGIAPTMHFASITSPRTTAVSSETISFNEAVTGFDRSDLTLTRNGGANLLTSSQTLTSADETTFTLENLAAITTTPGSYVLTLQAAGSGITGDGIALATGASVSWTTNAAVAPPTVSLAAISTPRTTSVASETITFSKAVAGFVLSDLTLTRNGGSNLLTTAQTLTTSNDISFTLGNLSAITTTPGSYVLTLKNSGINSDGIALAAGATVSWTTNAVVVAPTVKLTAITTPRTTPVSSETITFSETVAGFTAADLVLSRNGGSNLLTAGQTLTTANHIAFTLNNLSTLTKLAGNYTLTLKNAGITGNDKALAAGATISWHTNATIAGRHLFYNDSVFDKYNPLANSSDDQAIATDKTALFSGEKATFASYSSYYRGINGIMIDVNGLPAGSLTGADFTFKTGNTNTTSTWSAGPKPSSIVIRAGAGVGGSARIELVWANYVAKNTATAVAGKWLQVTLKADANTGLATADVFYFGSAIGETGNSKTDATVTSADVAAINAHGSTAAAPITSDWDITRSGQVNSSDATIASQNETSGATALQLITPH